MVSLGSAHCIFICHAGINRSSLALCYYCVTHGSVSSWQEARSALIAAKGGSAQGWPTLQNAAFLSYLERHSGGGSSRNSSAPSARGAADSSPSEPHWFWRTIASARQSTGGKDADPEAARLAQVESDDRRRNLGIDPKTGRVWGCWAYGKQGGVWVRGMPRQRRPWEGRDGASLGEGV